MGFITRSDHVVERTKGDPGELQRYRADVGSASSLMESLAEMIDSFTDGRVQGDGFTVAAIRQNAGENSTILRAAAEMFDRGGAAHGRYAAALQQNQTETSMQKMVIAAKHAVLMAAEAALAAATTPESKLACQKARDIAQEEFDRARDAFDRLVERNFDDQASCGSAVQDAANAFHEATKSVDGYSAASNIMAGIAAVAGIVALVLGGPIVAGVAWTAGAVSAGLMAKLWLDGERSTSDMVLETAGIVPFVGVFGDAARGMGSLDAAADVVDAAGVARLGNLGQDGKVLWKIPDGVAAAGIELRMTPEVARQMRREAADWAREANEAVPKNAAVPLNVANQGQPLFPTVDANHPIRGGSAVLHDSSFESLQARRAALSPEQLNDPRYDPSHPEFLGIARGGGGVSGPVLPDASPSVSGLTNKGSLVNGHIPDELAPLIEGPNSPLVLDYGTLRLRGITEIDVPASYGVRDMAELDRQLALTENGTNDISVRDGLAQLEEYRAKTHRLDPHSTWKSNMIQARVDDEVARGVDPAEALAAAKERFGGRAGIHSPDQVGGGNGYGVAGWGDSYENGKIGQMWQGIREDYAAQVRSQLESAGIPESLWDDVRMHVRFNVADVSDARVGLRE
ncbi:polymorphic toxin type 15 domain-containing protein [Agrococcus casei]|uniref:polymorphic toxin type 15 domain-containing protein n=1 Tax=Agrococcus casei TaxID=343512 RepID=UPI003F8F082A